MADNPMELKKYQAGEWPQDGRVFHINEVQARDAEIVRRLREMTAATGEHYSHEKAWKHVITLCHTLADEIEGTNNG